MIVGCSSGNMEVADTTQPQDQVPSGKVSTPVPEAPTTVVTVPSTSCVEDLHNGLYLLKCLGSMPTVTMPNCLLVRLADDSLAWQCRK